MQWPNSHDPKLRVATNSAAEPEQPNTQPGVSRNWTLQHFPRVYVAILDALDPHPAAQLAVRDALRRLQKELGAD